MSDDMSKYRDLFVQEASEHVQALNQSLLMLEDNPTSKDHLDAAFRAAHTIKGMAASMGYDQVRQICITIEETFDKLRKGEVTLSSNTAGVLFKCFDILAQMISDDKKTFDVNSLSSELRSSASEEQIPKSNKGENQSSPHEGKIESAEHMKDNNSLQVAGKSPTIRVKMTDMDSLIDLVGEIMIAKMRLEQSIKFLLSQAGDENGQEARPLLQSLGRLITNLQYRTMKIRLVPAEQIFERYPRIVRDLSSSLHKEVKFELSAHGIELDRSIVDAINDPLIHIIRNAVDHGIESADERIAKGKPRVGTIRLDAHRIGEKVAIEISDDGRGIDVQRVKQKAVEAGLITEDKANSMSELDAIRLIGTPGLSTAKEVTDVSGRGVGMDVVLKRIESVSGQTRIQTVKDKGTTIVLIIPLSLAIIGGILITVKHEKYVIPISDVLSVLKIDSNSIKTVNDQQVITLRDKVIPLIPAASIVGIEPDCEIGSPKKSHPLSDVAVSDKTTAVLIDKNGELIALTVDAVESKQDIVVKHIHRTGFEESSSPSDATILPDGGVALVLDTTQV